MRVRMLPRTPRVSDLTWRRWLQSRPSHTGNFSFATVALGVLLPQLRRDCVRVKPRTPARSNAASSTTRKPIVSTTRVNEEAHFRDTHQPLWRLLTYRCAGRQCHRSDYITK